MVAKLLAGHQRYLDSLERTRKAIGEPMPLKKALATICVEIGVKKYKAREYLEVLTYYGRFKVENDWIYPIKEAK